MTATSSLPWVDPGAYEVAPRVHRVPLPLPNDGLRAVNVYVIETDDGLVCIDAGWGIPESMALLVEALGSLDFALSDITRFLITHVHRDHYTQALDVRRQVGSNVGLGAGERPTLELLQDPERSPLSFQVSELKAIGAAKIADEIAGFSGHDRSDPSHWESPDQWLPGGPIVLAGRTLEAVETPGHTVGHLVFHDLEAKLLFAGDHVLPTITPSIGFEPVLVPNPLGAFMRSLALVRSRPDALLLPAHGPVVPSAHARVDELIDHHGRRLDEVAAAVAAGASNAYEVGGVLRWTRRQYRLEDLDMFNAMLAVFETGAHLELLAAQGRLTVSVVDGIRTYT